MRAAAPTSRSQTYWVNPGMTSEVEVPSMGSVRLGPYQSRARVWPGSPGRLPQIGSPYP